MLAAWLPVFTGGALASVVCKESLAPGHAHAAEHGSALADGHDEGGAGGASVGFADDCGGCDPCYSHCTLSLPGVGIGFFAPAHGAAVPAAPAALMSLSLPPADRPPLSRLG